MHRSSFRFTLPVLAGFAIAIAIALPARSAETRSFVIPQHDGYGISECLAHTGECGRVVADSWCESHGMSKAASYGQVEDVTAAIPHVAAAPVKLDPTEKAEPGSYVINCEP